MRGFVYIYVKSHETDGELEDLMLSLQCSTYRCRN